MAERRGLKRRHLFYYLRVFDASTDTMLGHLVNVTPEGAMLISENPIPVNTTFRLRMALPAEIMGKKELLLEGKSVWCRKDANPDFYNTGFQLLNATWDDLLIVEQLVDDFGSNEGPA